MKRYSGILSQQPPTEFARSRIISSTHSTSAYQYSIPEGIAYDPFDRSEIEQAVPMVSSTINVARYTALVTGVFYGIYHRRTLQKEHDQKKEHHAIHHRQDLIAEAKEAWRKRQQGGKDDAITDPEDPRFDLEKLIAKWESDS